MSSRAGTGRGLPGPWTQLAVALLGTFLGAFNNSVASVSLPAVLESFPTTSVAAGSWLLTGFIYASAVMVPLAGRLQDLLGARPPYLIGLILCAGASLLCALAPSFWALIAGRVLQGIVLAAVLPTVFITITNAFAPGHRGRALGVWAAVNGASLTAGPLLGGAIVATVGWRGVFYADIALALFAFAVAYRLLPAYGRAGTGRLDGLGAGLLIGALLALLLALSFAGGSGLGDGRTVAAAVIWLALTVTFTWRSARVPEPFIDPRLLRRAPFGVLTVIAGLQMISLFGLLLVVPLLLVTLHGSSDTHAGVLVALTPLTSTMLAPLTGRLADRVGGRSPLLVGGALLAVAGVVLAGAVESAGPALVAGLVLAGLGIGFIQSPAATGITRAAGPEQAGVAAGVFNASRLVSGAAGAAAFTVVFQLAAGIAPGGTLVGVAPDALAAGFRAVFVGVAAMGALVLALAVARGGQLRREGGAARLASVPAPER